MVRGEENFGTGVRGLAYDAEGAGNSELRQEGLCRDVQCVASRETSGGRSAAIESDEPLKSTKGARKSGCPRALAARRKYFPGDALCGFCHPWDSYDEDERRKVSMGQGKREPPEPPEIGYCFIHLTHTSARLAAEQKTNEDEAGSGRRLSGASAVKAESSWNSSKEPIEGQESVNAI